MIAIKHNTLILILVGWLVLPQYVFSGNADTTRIAKPVIAVDPISLVLLKGVYLHSQLPVSNRFFIDARLGTSIKSENTVRNNINWGKRNNYGIFSLNASGGVGYYMTKRIYTSVFFNYRYRTKWDVVEAPKLFSGEKRKYGPFFSTYVANPIGVRLPIGKRFLLLFEVAHGFDLWGGNYDINYNTKSYSWLHSIFFDFGYYF